MNINRNKNQNIAELFFDNKFIYFSMGEINNDAIETETALEATIDAGDTKHEIKETITVLIESVSKHKGKDSPEYKATIQEINKILNELKEEIKTIDKEITLEDIDIIKTRYKIKLRIFQLKMNVTGVKSTDKIEEVKPLPVPEVETSPIEETVHSHIHIGTVEMPEVYNSFLPQAIRNTNKFIQNASMQDMIANRENIHPSPKFQQDLTLIGLSLRDFTEISDEEISIDKVLNILHEKPGLKERFRFIKTNNIQTKEELQKYLDLLKTEKETQDKKIKDGEQISISERTSLERRIMQVNTFCENLKSSFTTMRYVYLTPGSKLETTRNDMDAIDSIFDDSGLKDITRNSESLYDYINILNDENDFQNLRELGSIEEVSSQATFKSEMFQNALNNLGLTIVDLYKNISNDDADNLISVLNSKHSLPEHLMFIKQYNIDSLSDFEDFFENQLKEIEDLSAEIVVLNGHPHQQLLNKIINKKELFSNITKFRNNYVELLSLTNSIKELSLTDIEKDESTNLKQSIQGTKKGMEMFDLDIGIKDEDIRGANIEELMANQENIEGFNEFQRLLKDIGISLDAYKEIMENYTILTFDLYTDVDMDHFLSYLSKKAPNTEELAWIRENNIHSEEKYTEFLEEQTILMNYNNSQEAANNIKNINEFSSRLNKVYEFLGSDKLKQKEGAEWKSAKTSDEIEKLQESEYQKLMSIETSKATSKEQINIILQSIFPPEVRSVDGGIFNDYQARIGSLVHLEKGLIETKEAGQDKDEYGHLSYISRNFSNYSARQKIKTRLETFKFNHGTKENEVIIKTNAHENLTQDMTSFALLGRTFELSKNPNKAEEIEKTYKKLQEKINNSTSLETLTEIAKSFTEQEKDILKSGFVERTLKQEVAGNKYLETNYRKRTEAISGQMSDNLCTKLDAHLKAENIHLTEEQLATLEANSKELFTTGAIYHIGGGVSIGIGKTLTLFEADEVKVSITPSLGVHVQTDKSPGIGPMIMSNVDITNEAGIHGGISLVGGALGGSYSFENNNGAKSRISGGIGIIPAIGTMPYLSFDQSIEMPKAISASTIQLLNNQGFNIPQGVDLSKLSNAEKVDILVQNTEYKNNLDNILKEHETDLVFGDELLAKHFDQLVFEMEKLVVANENGEYDENDGSINAGIFRASGITLAIGPAPLYVYPIPHFKVIINSKPVVKFSFNGEEQMIKDTTSDLALTERIISQIQSRAKIIGSLHIEEKLQLSEIVESGTTVTGAEFMSQLYLEKLADGNDEIAKKIKEALGMLVDYEKFSSRFTPAGINLIHQKTSLIEHCDGKDTETLGNVKLFKLETISGNQDDTRTEIIIDPKAKGIKAYHTENGLFLDLTNSKGMQVVRKEKDYPDKYLGARKHVTLFITNDPSNIQNISETKQSIDTQRYYSQHNGQIDSAGTDRVIDHGSLITQLKENYKLEPEQADKYVKIQELVKDLEGFQSDIKDQVEFHRVLQRLNLKQSSKEYIKKTLAKSMDQKVDEMWKSKKLRQTYRSLSTLSGKESQLEENTKLMSFIQENFIQNEAFLQNNSFLKDKYAAYVLQKLSEKSMSEIKIEGKAQLKQINKHLNFSKKIFKQNIDRWKKTLSSKERKTVNTNKLANLLMTKWSNEGQTMDKLDKWTPTIGTQLSIAAGMGGVKGLRRLEGFESSESMKSLINAEEISIKSKNKDEQLLARFIVETTDPYESLTGADDKNLDQYTESTFNFLRSGVTTQISSFSPHFLTKNEQYAYHVAMISAGENNPKLFKEVHEKNKHLKSALDKMTKIVDQVREADLSGKGIVKLDSPLNENIKFNIIIDRNINTALYEKCANGTIASNSNFKLVPELDTSITTILEDEKYAAVSQHELVQLANSLSIEETTLGLLLGVAPGLKDTPEEPPPDTGNDPLSDTLSTKDTNEHSNISGTSGGDNDIW